MAKGNGLGQQFYYQGYDLSGDVGSFNEISSPRTTLEATGINKSAVERLMGKVDGIIDFSGFFNKASEAQHDALNNLPTTDVIALWAEGEAVGDSAVGLVGKQENYQLQRGEDGSLEHQCRVVGNGVAPMYGEMLSAGKDVSASAAAETSKDDAASSANGLEGILEIFDIDSGTPTVVLQDSPDNSAWATLISFTAVASGSEPTAERKTVSGTVDRYLRLNITGTYTNLDFAFAYRRGESTDKVAY